jgi:mono/diheme cytochrome c family protein
MTSVTVLRACFVALIAWLCAVSMGSLRAPALSDVVVARVEAQGPDIGTEAQRESGRILYVKNCAQCHGENGDGVGYATPHLSPLPRDFTTGRFKVRTTPNGTLPLHQDLVSIIRRGMPYTSMPDWPGLSDQDVANLAYYLTTFSPDFSNPELAPQPMELPSGPSVTDESIELGKNLYVETGCVKCHGNLGRGDGPSAPTLTDDLGRPIRAANLAQSWTFRAGSSREDIYRTMSTGFNGTPMPSFTDSLTPEQRWAITDYILSLSDSDGPGYTNLVVARPVQDPIDLANGVASFESAPVARFPILGQITEPGRSFHPPTTSVTVRAVYDAESIAVLVQWHDMSTERTGTNGPTLPVPPEEEESAPGGAAPTDDNPFGDAEGIDQPAADPFADAVPTVPDSEFSDSVAIQIPSQVPAGPRKPYFIFGDAQNPVDLWFFDLARPEPLQFTGRGSADVTPNDTGDVTGVASYDQGEWSVIFRRPLRPSLGASLSSGAFMPIAFSVWDGLSRERGNRRGLTVWNSVYLEPEVVPSAVGPMVRTGLLILLFELIVIAWVRSRYATRGRDELSGERRQQPVTSV